MRLYLDSATIYQIHYQHYAGLSQREIARQLGISRHSVGWHLAGHYKALYTPTLLRRISFITPYKPRSIKLPDDFLRLDEASYFFPHRPFARTIQEGHRKLKTRIVCGMKVTRREWVTRYVESRYGDAPHGVVLNQDVLYTVLHDDRARCKRHRDKVTRLCDIDSELFIPSFLISRLVSIQLWTNRPYIGIRAHDLAGLSTTAGR